MPLQRHSIDVHLCGKPLDDCPRPVSFIHAIRLSRRPGRTIWHVRRNNEMLAAIFVRDILRLPIKLVFTSAATRRHSAFPRWLISRMDAVVATSDAAAVLVPNVAAVIPHGVDLKRFKPAPDRGAAWASLGFGGKAGFITVGRVRPEKGTDTFVDAMLTLLPQLPDYHAVMIGKTTPEFMAFRKMLEHKIAAAGLSERIIFAGERAPSQIPGIMSAATLLFALPRYEGYGLTALEAMACGTPVIATDAGSFQVFIAESGAGMIVTADGASDAAHALVEDHAGYARMSQSCRTRVRPFGIEGEVMKLSEVYKKLEAVAVS